MYKKCCFLKFMLVSLLFHAIIAFNRTWLLTLFY